MGKVGVMRLIVRFPRAVRTAATKFAECFSVTPRVRGKRATAGLRCRCKFACGSCLMPWKRRVQQHNAKCKA